MIYKGNKEIGSIYLGNKEVIAAYFGNKLVWENGLPSCYAQGLWRDDFLWTDNTVWKDNTR